MMAERGFYIWWPGGYWFWYKIYSWCDFLFDWRRGTLWCFFYRDLLTAVRGGLLSWAWDDEAPIPTLSLVFCCWRDAVAYLEGYLLAVTTAGMTWDSNFELAVDEALIILARSARSFFWSFKRCCMFGYEAVWCIKRLIFSISDWLAGLGLGPKRGMLSTIG